MLDGTGGDVGFRVGVIEDVGVGVAIGCGSGVG